MTKQVQQNAATHGVLQSLDAASTLEARIQHLPAFQKATKFVPVYLRACSSDTTDSHVEEVLAHLEEVFVFKGYRYRGANGEASARSLIKRVARNKLLQLLRRRELQAEHAEAATAKPEPGLELAHRAGRRVVREVREALRSTPSGESNLALLLETAFFGLTTREQAVRAGFPSDLPKADWVRVRNLLDNRRRLGRRALSKALRKLVADKRIHRMDARVFAEFCGCEWDTSATKGGLRCA